MKFESDLATLRNSSEEST